MALALGYILGFLTMWVIVKLRQWAKEEEQIIKEDDEHN